MPPDILLETRDLSEKLELQSGAGVQWSGFQKKHVDKKAERNSLRRFLAYAKRDFEEFSDAYPKQLEELRTEVAEIHFLPERKKGRRFETLNQEGRKRLLIYFRKEDGRWEGSLKPYLERRFGITLHP